MKTLNMNFEEIGGLVILKGIINNEEKLFVFDTGASGLVLNAKYQKGYVKLDYKNTFGATEIDNNLIKKQMINSVSFADYKINNLEAKLIDFTYVEKPLEMKIGKPIEIYGVVGADLFSDNPFLIDYQQSTLTFCPQNIDIKTSIDFEFDKHLIIFSGHIGKQKHNFILDTGANINLLDINLFDELEKNGELTNGTKSIKLINGLDIANGSGNLTIKLFGMNFKNLNCRFADIQALKQKTSIKISGIIGYTILSKLKVLFDYEHKKLSLIN